MPQIFFLWMSSSILLDFIDYQLLLVGGDFNAMWIHQEDRTGGRERNDQKLASNAIQKTVNKFILIDSWHLMNPSSWEGFTGYYLAQHKTFSRIVHMLQTCIWDNLWCWHHTLPLSDHRALLCPFLVKIGHTRWPRWHFNTLLLQNEVFKRERQQELDFFINN